MEAPDVKPNVREDGMSTKVWSKHRKGKEDNFVKALFIRELTGSKGFSPEIIQNLYKTTESDEEIVNYNVIRRIGHTMQISCITFDASGEFILTGSSDLLLKIWRISDGMLMACLRGVKSSVCQLAINYDNSVVAAGCNDNSVICWRLRHCDPMAIMDGFVGRLTGVAFSPVPKTLVTPRYLACSYADGIIRLWKYDNVRGQNLRFQTDRFCMIRDEGADSAIKLMDFSTGGSFFATINTDRVLRIYEMTRPQGPAKIVYSINHANHIVQLRFGFWSLKLLTASEDGSVLLWTFDGSTFLKYKRLCCDAATRPALRQKISVADFNCDDSLIITVIGENVVKVWSSDTGILIATTAQHVEPVHLIACHPTLPHLICTVGRDNQLLMWSMEQIPSDKQVMTTKVLMKYNNDRGVINDLAWSSDGMTIGFGDSNGNLVLLTPCKNEKSTNLPVRMFYQTDSIPVITQSQNQRFEMILNGMEYHLLPTGVLEDGRGVVHSTEVQQKIIKKDLNGLPMRPIIPPPTVGEIDTMEEILLENTINEVLVCGKTVLPNTVMVKQKQEIFGQPGTCRTRTLALNKKQRLQQMNIKECTDTEGFVRFLARLKLSVPDRNKNSRISGQNDCPPNTVSAVAGPSRPLINDP